MWTDCHDKCLTLGIDLKLGWGGACCLMFKIPYGHFMFAFSEDWSAQPATEDWSAAPTAQATEWVGTATEWS